MSYTEIFKFKKNGESESVNQFRNSFAGAVNVWNKLEEKYLPKLQFPRMVLNKMDDIWKLSDNENLLLYEKICLLSTFDKVVVKKENFPRLISAFRAWENNSSLPKQAETIFKLQDDDDCIGIAWNQTSVCEPFWRSYDEDLDEMVSYNLLKENEHWFLFDSIEEKSLTSTE